MRYFFVKKPVIIFILQIPSHMLVRLLRLLCYFGILYWPWQSIWYLTQFSLLLSGDFQVYNLRHTNVFMMVIFCYWQNWISLSSLSFHKPNRRSSKRFLTGPFLLWHSNLSLLSIFPVYSQATTEMKPTHLTYTLILGWYWGFHQHQTSCWHSKYQLVS